MQTFLPYKDFKKTAKTLDYRRLGKQRLEAKVLIEILSNPSDKKKGWINHPATKMWRGYLEALKLYYDTIVEEWINRGYNNTMPMYIVNRSNVKLPHWLDEDFCSRHRSALLYKDAEYYGKYNWKEEAKLDYRWGN